MQNNTSLNIGQVMSHKRYRLGVNFTLETKLTTSLPPSSLNKAMHAFWGEPILLYKNNNPLYTFKTGFLLVIISSSSFTFNRTPMGYSTITNQKGGQHSTVELRGRRKRRQLALNVKLHNIPSTSYYCTSIKTSNSYPITTITPFCT